MKLPGVRLRSEGLFDEANKNLVLKFFLILDSLADGALSPVNLNQGDAILETIRSLNGRELSENATAFLWYSVHVIHEMLDHPADIPLFVWPVFLAQIIDSFFPILRDGDSIQLPALNGMDIILPRLGVKLTKPGSCVLLRASDEELIFGAPQSNLRINVSKPAEYELSRMPTRGGAYVLSSTRDLLFDEMAEDKVALLAAPELSAFVKQLSKALELIDAADSDLGKRIQSEIKWYWPIKTPDKRVVHNSFSVSALHGGIFLSEHYSYPIMAEALVHEFYHNELSFLMSVDPHLERPDDATLYSPWRTDPRPLFGLYHGIYVFTGLLEFFRSAEQQPALERYHAYFRSRRESIYFQLRTAIAQVPPSRLKARACEVVDWVREIIDYHGEALGLRSLPAPETQLNHWQQWIAQNAALGQTATPPVGAYYTSAA